MGDVMVEKPLVQAATQRRPIPSSVPNFEGLETSSEVKDEYATLKALQRQLEFVQETGI